MPCEKTSCMHAFCIFFTFLACVITFLCCKKIIVLLSYHFFCIKVLSAKFVPVLNSNCLSHVPISLAFNITWSIRNTHNNFEAQKALTVASGLYEIFTSNCFCLNSSDKISQLLYEETLGASTPTLRKCQSFFNGIAPKTTNYSYMEQLRKNIVSRQKNSSFEEQNMLFQLMWLPFTLCTKTFN